MEGLCNELAKRDGMAGPCEALETKELLFLTQEKQNVTEVTQKGF